MNDRHAELMAGYLDGALSDAEREELLQALRQDPELFKALAQEIEIHRTLRFSAAGGPGDDAGSADRILEYIQSPSDCTDFLERVKERARAEASPEKKTSRRAVVSTRRSPNAMPFALAACAAVAILLLVIWPDSSKPLPAPRGGAHQSPTPKPAVVVAPREQERREAELRVREIEREQQRLADEKPKALDAEQRRKVETELARNQAALQEAQKALARIEEPRPQETPPSVVPAPVLQKTEAERIVPIATLERLEGQVFAISAGQKSNAKVGRALMPGEGVETRGTTARAYLKLADGTKLELGGGATIQKLGSREGADGAGTWIDLSGLGFLAATVVKQPQDRALVIATPQGEARVLGTTLRVVTEANGTRLEVTEGHVRLTRKTDTKTVDVMSGQYAVAASGAEGPEFMARPVPPDVITVAFSAPGQALPAGVLLDTGEEFDAKRGYGWIGPKVGREIEQPYIDPTTGKKWVWNAGRNPGASPGADILETGYVAAGSIMHTETWTLPLPNDRYLVTVCVGGTIYKQGPHHVKVETLQIINRAFTAAAQHFVVKDIPVEVKDGEFTMILGGSGGRPSDPSTDTILNYIVIKKAGKK